MNAPSPISPLSPLAQQSKGKSNVRIAVISIIALHGVFFGILLLQGCKQKPIDTSLGGTGTNTYATNDLAAFAYTNLPPFGTDTNPLAQAPLPTNQFGTPTTPGAGPTAPLTPPSEIVPSVPAATTGGEYTIKAGDTPAKIAKAHGVSLNALMKANPGLDARKLKIGQKIQLPAPPAPAAGTAAAGTPAASDPTAEPAKVHLVKAGENLIKIAKQHGVSVKELRAANNLKTDRINTGQKLKVPAAKAAPASTAGATAAVAPPAGAAGAR